MNPQQQQQQGQPSDAGRSNNNAYSTQSRHVPSLRSAGGSALAAGAAGGNIYSSSMMGYNRGQAYVAPRIPAAATATTVTAPSSSSSSSMSSYSNSNNISRIKNGSYNYGSADGKANNFDMYDIVSVCRQLKLPEAISKSYQSKGINSLYQWQYDCLFKTPGVTSNPPRNLLYCAPTSGGKTLVAELLMLRSVLVLGKKAIFVLPYIALVEEKSKYFKKLLFLLNRSQNKAKKCSIAEVYGNNKKNSYDLMKTDIFICTVEKANQIINDMIRKNILKKHLGSVVIDEFHMIGDSFQGFILETIISKLLWLKLKDGDSAAAIDVQVIAMSATVSNVEMLQKYLNSAYFMTDFRPIPLREYIIHEEKRYDKKGCLVDKAATYSLVNIVSNVVKKNQQAIIFCGSKKNCQTTISKISSHFQDNKINVGDPSLASKREELITKLKLEPDSKSIGNTTDDLLISLIESGLAYHHAACRNRDRDLIEEAFRAGVISIITCTTTLSAGINLPATVVIINGLDIGASHISSTLYQQMVGRAGRMGYSSGTSTSSSKSNKGGLLNNEMKLGDGSGSAGIGGGGVGGGAGTKNEGVSFIMLNNKSNKEFEAAKTIATSKCAAVYSQLNPTLVSSDYGTGTAFLKLLIEVIGLKLALTSAQSHHAARQQDGPHANLSLIRSFFSRTLLFVEQDEKPSDTKLDVSAVVNTCCDFLIQSKIISMKGAEEEITLTKFGYAMFVCNLDIDDSIEFYERLIQVQQSGIILEDYLHLLTILVPWDDFKLRDISSSSSNNNSNNNYSSSNSGSMSLTIQIDMDLISNLVSKSLGQKKPSVIARVCSMLGVNTDKLTQLWSMPGKGPSQKEFHNCFVRKTFRHFISNSNSKKTAATAATSTAALPLTKISKKDEDWQMMCGIQRIYVSLIIWECMKTGNLAGIEKITRGYGSGIAQLDHVVKKTLIIARKMKNFCNELGMMQFIPLCEKLIDVLEVSFSKNTESGETLILMSMFPDLVNRQVAMVLHKYDVRTVEALSKQTSVGIFNMLNNATGFNPDDISSADNYSSNSSNSREHEFDGDVGGGIKAISSKEARRLNLFEYIKILIAKARDYMDEVAKDLEDDGMELDEALAGGSDANSVDDSAAESDLDSEEDFSRNILDDNADNNHYCDADESFDFDSNNAMSSAAAASAAKKLSIKPIPLSDFKNIMLSSNNSSIVPNNTLRRRRSMGRGGQEDDDHAGGGGEDSDKFQDNSFASDLWSESSQSQSQNSTVNAAITIDDISPPTKFLKTTKENDESISDEALMEHFFLLDSNKNESTSVITIDTTKDRRISNIFPDDVLNSVLDNFLMMDNTGTCSGSNITYALDTNSNTNFPDDEDPIDDDMCNQAMDAFVGEQKTSSSLSAAASYLPPSLRHQQQSLSLYDNVVSSNSNSNSSINVSVAFDATIQEIHALHSISALKAKAVCSRQYLLFNNNNLTTTAVWGNKRIKLVSSSNISSNCRNGSNESGNEGDITDDSFPFGPRNLRCSVSKARSIRKRKFCEEFLRFARTADSISIEVMYKQIPISASRSVSDSGRIKSIIKSWKPYIAFSCKESCVVEGFNWNLDLSEEDTSPIMKFGSESQIIVGVALNFGDEFGYYLPLPTPLPSPLWCQSPPSFSSSSSFLPSYYSGATTTGTTDPFRILPLRAKQLITTFVGFSSILHKTDLKFADDFGNFDGKMPYLSADSARVSNPLLSVSREWMIISRNALLAEFSANPPVEWTLLSSLMSNPKVVKIAAGIKNVIVNLRDRHIKTSGPIEDPLIISRLFKSCNDDSIRHLLKLNAPVTSSQEKFSVSVSPSDAHEKNIMFKVVAVTRALERVHSVLCFPSPPLPSPLPLPFLPPFNASVNVNMNSNILPHPDDGDSAFISIRSNLEKNMYLYNVVEMPLIRSLSLNESSGIALDLLLLKYFKQLIKDRLKMLDYFVKSMISDEFNVDSNADLSKLKGSIRHSIEEINKNQNLIPEGLQQHGKKCSGMEINQSNQSIQSKENLCLGRGEVHEEEEEEGGNSALVNSFISANIKSISNFVDSHPIVNLVLERRLLSKCDRWVDSVLDNQLGKSCRIQFDSISFRDGRVSDTYPTIHELPSEVKISNAATKLTLLEEINSNNKASSNSNPNLNSNSNLINNDSIMSLEAKINHDIQILGKDDTVWVDDTSFKISRSSSTYSSSSSSSLSLHHFQQLQQPQRCSPGLLFFIIPGQIYLKDLLNKFGSFLQQFQVRGKKRNSAGVGVGIGVGNDVGVEVDAEVRKRLGILSDELFCVSCKLDIENPSAFSDNKNLFSLLENVAIVELKTNTPFKCTCCKSSASNSSIFSSSSSSSTSASVELKTQRYFIVPLTNIKRLVSPIKFNVEEVSNLNRSIQSNLWIANEFDIRSDSDLSIGGATIKRAANTNNNVLLLDPRRCFRSHSDFEFLSIQFCELEMRILAHLSSDLKLIDVFRRSKLIESATASRPQAEGDFYRQLAASWLYKRVLSGGSLYVDDSCVSDSDLIVVKIICTAILNGTEAKRITQQLSEKNISTFNYPALASFSSSLDQSIGSALKADFLKEFDGVSKYIASAVTRGRKSGFSESILGRRKGLDIGFHRRDSKKIDALIISSTIQSSLSDIKKQIMIHLTQSISDAFCSTVGSAGEAFIGIFEFQDKFVLEIKKTVMLEAKAIAVECIENSFRDFSAPIQTIMRTGGSLDSI